MTSRLAGFLAEQARAVERDRRRPPVGIEESITGSGSGYVGASLGSDSGTGSVSVSGSLALPGPGIWLLVVEVSVSGYSSAVAAPGMLTAQVGPGPKERALAPGGTTRDGVSSVIAAPSSGTLPVGAGAVLVDGGDSVAVFATAIAVHIGSYP